MSRSAYPAYPRHRAARASRVAEGALWLVAAVLGGIWLGWRLEVVIADRAFRPPAEPPIVVSSVATSGIDAAEPLAFPPEPPWPELENGTPIGRLAIPRLGIDAVILEGDDESVLRLAVGHLPDTALPGEGGTIALAAHRDSFFRPLEGVAAGDLVTLESERGARAFRVTGTRVVEPDALDVLADLGRERLTLITCYPFRWVGPAPRRFVVFAEPVDSGVESGDPV